MNRSLRVFNNQSLQTLSVMLMQNRELMIFDCSAAAAWHLWPCCSQSMSIRKVLEVSIVSNEQLHLLYTGMLQWAGADEHQCQLSSTSTQTNSFTHCIQACFSGQLLMNTSACCFLGSMVQQGTDKLSSICLIWKLGLASCQGKHCSAVKLPGVMQQLLSHLPSGTTGPSQLQPQLPLLVAHGQRCSHTASAASRWLATAGKPHRVPAVGTDACVHMLPPIRPKTKQMR